MMNKKSIHTEEAGTSKLTRREFIKIGSATVVTTVITGSIWKFLIPRLKRKAASFEASAERPNKNPAFIVRKKRNGSLVCYTLQADGNVLRHELNDVAAALFWACDGKHFRKDIIRQAAQKLHRDSKPFTVEAEKFLSELERQNLIVTTNKVNLYYRTVVRYE